MRLLAQDPLRYRRQVLALKHFFSTRACTVLFLDDKTGEPGDLQLHSLAHGVISLEQTVQGYGTEHRRLRVVKMRGQPFQRGSHDFLLDTGRLSVFPRLTASQHRAEVTHETVSTGVPELDRMLGGGLSRGTNTLLIGPSGAGKTTTAMRCVRTALERGEKGAYYLFDEGVSTVLLRTRHLQMEVDTFVESGRLQVRPVDPSELSPGEFACDVVSAVERDGCSFVVIDSLNAYQQAMPGESFLLLHMHELLTYLNHLGVTTILVVAQHGVVSDVRSDLDLSYLSDAMLLFRYFEAAGGVRTAITAVKSRTLANEHTIREFRMSPTQGIQVGAPLAGFEGILGGAPDYRGETELIDADRP
jgi:circadian clock protein KaiC